MRHSLTPILAALLLLGCAPRVARLSLADPRLPLEARRWLADAEDEVAIARASLDEAQTSLDDAEEFRRYVDRNVNTRWPSGGGSSAARQRLETMVEERTRLARLEVDAANARIVHAQAMLVRARAETAVRHDLAAYDLEPIIETAEAARATLDDYANRIEQQRIRVDESTTGWWEAYGAYLQSGGDNSVLWVWGQE